MELLVHSRVAKTIYGIFFVIVVPLALIAWTRGAANTVRLHPVHSALWGAMLLSIGIATMVLGMASLWIYGGGLPMNAFPPTRFVESSIYSIVPHPIYGGFIIACAGAAIVSGSAAGLWLVTPFVALACSALVLGYELPDLHQRFSPRKSSPWLPVDRTDAPSRLERLRIYPVILLPWLVVFEMLGALGKAPDSVSTYLPFELGWPVIEPTELLYASTYLVVLAVPLLARSGRALRRFAQQGLIAMALIFPLYLFLPFFVPPRDFHPTTAIAPLLLWERVPTSGIAAFPSFHVVWAFIAASALGEASRWRKYLWGAWAVLVAISCVTTGMHSIADVLAGLLAYLLITRMEDIWQTILRVAEHIANSWKQWRLGPVRIINHGGYAALAVLLGMAIIDALLGPGREMITVSIFLCSTVGAALWAQWVEGSPALLRPMGFYGSMIGAVLGATSALFLHVNLWIVLAAICIAAPVIQAVGRLRCLVQGCCHGRAADAVPGIRYTEPHSRVCRLSSFSGIPIHATPVYSILWNGVVWLSLLRLLQLHAACTLIFGIYLLLSSAGRFVEEAYRGEPQTATILGLHLYQWIAIAAAIAGAILTTIKSAPIPPPGPFRLTSIVLALGCAAIAWFVTGIDFPESSRRFARLT